MKTHKFYTVLTILLVIMFAIALNASASESQKTENPPTIIEHQLLENGWNIQNIGFDEEQYIDDIPFDTELLSAQSLYKIALMIDFDFDEETYIDDIPFDTFAITQVYYQGHFAESK